MRSYAAARELFSFLGFCSWVVIIFGVLVAIGGFAAATSGMIRNPSILHGVLGALPGGTLSLLGSYGLALVQMGRAGVDSAEYGQQALQVARDQLEVSRQMLSQSSLSPASCQQVHATDTPPVDTETTDEPAADTAPSYATRPEPVATTTAALEAEPANTDAADPPAALPEPLAELTVADIMPEPEPEPEPVTLEPSPPVFHQFAGSTIEEYDGTFTVDGREYDTLLNAKLSVDANLARAEA